MQIPEFTCLCPKTGQPDFATLELEYVPDRLCVELKSLKLYIWSFRDRGAFHEAVTNEIADHLPARCAPRFLRLTARFNVRGGIYTTRRRRAPTARLAGAAARQPALARPTKSSRSAAPAAAGTPQPAPPGTPVHAEVGRYNPAFFTSPRCQIEELTDAGQETRAKAAKGKKAASRPPARKALARKPEARPRPHCRGRIRTRAKSARAAPQEAGRRHAPAHAPEDDPRAQGQAG